MLVFVFTVVVSAVPIQVGVVYDDVIKELGKPDGKITIGNKQVLTYGDAKVAIRDKNVISVSPEFKRLLEERESKLRLVKFMRESNYVNYRGQWVTPEEKKQIMRAEQNEENLPANDQTNESVWLSDFAEASALARSQNKKILLSFTGSDWCAWSIKLDEEVLSKSEFLQEAQQEYVMVNLDFPKRKKLHPEVKEQNESLAQQFKIGSFPSIIVLNSNGDLQSAGVYADGKPEDFIKSVL